MRLRGFHLFLLFRRGSERGDGIDQSERFDRLRQAGLKSAIKGLSVDAFTCESGQRYGGDTRRVEGGLRFTDLSHERITIDRGQPQIADHYMGAPSLECLPCSWSGIDRIDLGSGFLK